MTVSFSQFVFILAEYPSMVFMTILILGVIVVNGWTDAPNSITACISTRALDPEKAVIMATFLNFLGVFFITMINAKVAETIFNIADFRGHMGHSIIALCSSQIAILIWSLIALHLGIPTSESHALVAGLTGSAIALHQGFSGVNFHEWAKVLYGMFGSTLMGVLVGFLFAKIIKYHFFYRDRRELNSYFIKGQIAGSASMAFLHGMQSGQKFMGVFLLVLTLGTKSTGVYHLEIPVWLMLITSLTLAYGTSLGGYQIIRSVGVDMVKMEKHEGFASDLGAVVIILFSTILGLPVSTTHIKMSSFVGVGLSKRLSNLNWHIVRSIFIAWVLTFPGCGLIGYIITYVLIRIF